MLCITLLLLLSATASSRPFPALEAATSLEYSFANVGKNNTLTSCRPGNEPGWEPATSCPFDAACVRHRGSEQCYKPYGSCDHGCPTHGYFGTWLPCAWVCMANMSPPPAPPAAPPTPPQPPSPPRPPVAPRLFIVLASLAILLTCILFVSVCHCSGRTYNQPARRESTSGFNANATRGQPQRRVEPTRVDSVVDNHLWQARIRAQARPPAEPVIQSVTVPYANESFGSAAVDVEKQWRERPARAERSAPRERSFADAEECYEALPGADMDTNAESVTIQTDAADSVVSCDHARERCKERGITREERRAVIKHGTLLPAKPKKGRLRWKGVHGGVVGIFDESRKNAITWYRKN